MAKQEQDDSLFDTRVLHHRLRREVVSAEDYQKYLDALPDSADEAVDTVTQFSTPFQDRHTSSRVEQPEDDSELPE
ncbi:MAG: hypothetical protein JRI25_00730 [Deltaproteobacteria bacterium]|nr:hypothetical protein [Deltaproteobacteria bacterium]MBW2253102.1 hypothetical protein [Deltaproteobacteria bacterium]